MGWQQSTEFCQLVSYDKARLQMAASDWEDLTLKKMDLFKRHLWCWSDPLIYVLTQHFAEVLIYEVTAPAASVSQCTEVCSSTQHISGCSRCQVPPPSCNRTPQSRPFPTFPVMATSLEYICFHYLWRSTWFSGVRDSACTRKDGCKISNHVSQDRHIVLLRALIYQT